MREVTIYTEKDQYLPGDKISGHILVSTDKPFTCNRIMLKIRGKEYTHYQAGKVHVSETNDLLNEEINIWEGGDIQSGDSRFEFEFMLPEDIPPVHKGVFGVIDYSIEAVAEVDRALDPKSKRDLRIGTFPPPYIPEPLDQAPLREEKENLQAEIPTDIIRPNREFVVRFMVGERSRIKGVRLDIAQREDVSCQGRSLNSMKLVREKHIPITYNDYERWIEETLFEDWNTLLPFEGKLIKSSIVLKVVLEIGLSLDPSIELPLKLSGEEKTEDIQFESIDLDFGW
ncbi:MAG: hypothetical protein ACFFCX_08225 [Candidatus Sifarchaeia archaeon]